MISISVTGYFKKILGAKYRLYRLFFNLIAILTPIPVALFAYSIRTQAIFQWNRYMRIGQVLILGGGSVYRGKRIKIVKYLKDHCNENAKILIEYLSNGSMGSSIKNKEEELIRSLLLNLQGKSYKLSTRF
jgi:hypothetical protein